MKKIPQKDIEQLQQKILGWYVKNKRDLPWRQTRDPYCILVSEVMLQQTQVARVLPKYKDWLTSFPKISDLASAKTDQVLRLWSGLGYNRRAIYLQKTAKIIVEKNKGKFPQDEKLLQTLPGVGEYTAKAVLCFAYNVQKAVVDTNIRKVISLVFFNGKPPSDKILQQAADQLLPKGKAYEWNQALMDYAASVLAKEKIPLKKQSAFRGSNRYYRGRIIKLLLVKEQRTVEELSGHLGKDMTEVVKRLHKEGLVFFDGTKVKLP